MESRMLIRRMTDFQVRTISALVLMPAVLMVVHVGRLLFNLSVAFIAALIILEWYNMIKGVLLSRKLVFIKWMLAGICYALIFFFSLYFIRQSSLILLYWTLFCVWSVDMSAYIAGTLIGGRKVNSRISPKKTWSGLLGGVIGANIVGITFEAIDHSTHYSFMSLCVAIIAQAGDLFESYFKRLFNTKDSGSIIPGHGGVLDRVDSLVPAALFVVLVLFMK